MATKGDTVHDSGDALGHSPTIYTAIANPVEMTDTTAAATEPSTVTEPSATDAASALPSSVKSNVSENKWPGWPGYCVFRLIVPVLKVGSIIGRKGELIKKICEETRARVRVLDAPLGTPDRVVSSFLYFFLNFAVIIVINQILRTDLKGMRIWML